jgi:hypothetical protein
MRFPVYLVVGGASVHPHVLFDALAYASGLWLPTRRRADQPDIVDARTRWIVSAAAVMGGWSGSHLLFAAEDVATLRLVSSDPIRWKARR